LDCIFCKIANKEISSKIIAESENSLAFLDAFPLTKGHSLVIPKNHHEKVQNMSKVEVDPSLCIGCCSCETIAPEVFAVDKLIKLNPKSHVYNERGAGYNKIMNAAETCPTKAISVEDKDTKRKLFPW